MKSNLKKKEYIWGLCMPKVRVRDGGMEAEDGRLQVEDQPGLPETAVSPTRTTES